MKTRSDQNLIKPEKNIEVERRENKITLTILHIKTKKIFFTCRYVSRAQALGWQYLVSSIRLNKAQ